MRGFENMRISEESEALEKENESFDSRSVLNAVMNAIMVNVMANNGDWLNHYMDFVPDAFAIYEERNPGVLKDWEDYSRRNEIIADVKKGAEKIYEERNRLAA